jgi:hypothetical protein
MEIISEYIFSEKFPEYCPEDQKCVPMIGTVMGITNSYYNKISNMISVLDSIPRMGRLNRLGF